MTEYLIVALAPLAMLHIFVHRRNALVSADTIFVMVQLMMVYGTYPLIDQSSAVEREYMSILLLCVYVYLVASFIFGAVLTPGERSYRVLVHRPGGGVKLSLVLSVAVVSAYFYAVGYVTVFQGLSNLASGGQENDIATLRLESYAGSRYLFPGYVNQFKNSLLPGLALVVVTFWISKRPRRYISSLLLILVAFIGLVGTGQRGAFVIAFLVGLTYLYLLNRRRFAGRASVALVVFIPLMIGLTAALGRNAATDSADRGLIGNMSEQVLNRFISSNQQSGIAGYVYTHSKPTANGVEWIQGIVGMLPGVRGSTLSSEIFATLYGGTRGTSPPSLWGSVDYNFGPAGLVLVPIILAFINQWVACRSLLGTEHNTLEVVGWAGVNVSLGMWTAGGPVFLFNVGLVMWMLLIWAGRRIRRRTIGAERDSDGALDDAGAGDFRPRPGRGLEQRPELFGSVAQSKTQ